MSGKMWWSRDEDGEVHPDVSILLAYIRQQSLGMSRLDIHQHMAHCEECQKRYNELRQPSTILDEALHWSVLPILQEDVVWDWLQSPAEAQLAYQRRQHERLQEDLALGKALLKRLPQVLQDWLAQAMSALLPYMWKEKLAPRRRGKRGMGIIPLSSGLAVAFLILALTAIVVFAAMSGNNPFQPSHLPGGIATARAQPTAVVPAHSTSTSAVGSQSGVTLTPAGPLPTIFECNDKKTHHFSICGKNFKPNTKVELVVQLADGSSRTRDPVSVDSSGNFQDVWSNSACKDVPITVFVQNITRPSVDLGELQNIQYGKCSPNPMQRTGTNHH